jgi:hypothetical protein
MIRPVKFGFNEQTAESNAFQLRTREDDVHQEALKEFDQFVAVLQENGVNVTVFDDTLTPHTPDSVFPNNWISFHDDGSVFLYPMQAENRRMERRLELMDELKQKFEIRQINDLSSFENEEKFLEGTGSMVLDRENKIAYACLSPRTDLDVLSSFCLQSGYRPVSFHSVDRHGKEIYHTNVMMCVGSQFVVICLETISDQAEKNQVVQTIISTGKAIIEISIEQMEQFAGNMLQVRNRMGEELTVMSERAYQALTPDQIARLEKYCRLVHSPLTVIENNGGGSARCMMAEIHLPPTVKD